MERGAIKEQDRIPDVSAFILYTDAFQELGTCRQIGMSLGPIPFYAIVEYAKLYKIDDLEEFLYIIRKMDEAYLKTQEKKSNVNAADSKANNNRGGGPNRRKPR